MLVEWKSFSFANENKNDFSEEFEESSLVYDYLYTSAISTPEHRQEVQNWFASNSAPTHDFTWVWEANVSSAFEWLPNNPGIFGAIGAVTITGSVTVTVRESDLRITMVHFTGSLDDLYDGNYKKPGNEEIATVQAGYPTLGDGGRIFKTHLEFEDTFNDGVYSYDPSWN